MSSMLDPAPGEEVRVVEAVQRAIAKGATCEGTCDDEHTYEPGMCLAAVVMAAQDEARAEAIEAESANGHRLIIRSDETTGRKGKRTIRYDCALITCDLAGTLEHIEHATVGDLFALIASQHASVTDAEVAYDWATQWTFPDGDTTVMSANSAGRTAETLARKRAKQLMRGATSASAVRRVRYVGPWLPAAAVPAAREER